MRQATFWLEAARRLLVLVTVIAALPGRGFVPGRPKTAQGRLFYTCEAWPNCDLETEEYIPEHKYDPSNPPYCRLHKTTPMIKEVHLP